MSNNNVCLKNVQYTFPTERGAKTGVKVPLTFPLRSLNCPNRKLRIGREVQPRLSAGRSPLIVHWLFSSCSLRLSRDGATRGSRAIPAGLASRASLVRFPLSFRRRLQTECPARQEEGDVSEHGSFPRTTGTLAGWTCFPGKDKSNLHTV